MIFEFCSLSFVHLHNICEGLFPEAEIQNTGNQDENDDHGGGRQHGDGGNRSMDGSPAEAFDDAGHGIQQAVSQAEFRRDDGAGINDRRGKEQALDEEGYDITDVTVFHVESGQPQADAQGKSQDQPQQGDEKYHVPLRHVAVYQHQTDEDNKGEQEVDQRRQDAGEGGDEAGEVYFLDQGSIIYQAVTGPGYPAREKVPGGHGGKNK